MFISYINQVLHKKTNRQEIGIDDLLRYQQPSKGMEETE